MKCSDVLDFFESTFKISLFTSIDSSLNGLQVGRKEKDINKVGFSVSASMDVFRKAKDLDCDMLFVHHGIFWGKNEALTGFRYDRVKFLMDNDLSLYACHLPLDSHEKLSNNMGLALELGLNDIRGFASFKGFNMGLYGNLSKPLSCSEIFKKICPSVYTDEPKTLICKDPLKANISKVGIVSGSGSRDLYEGMELDLDLFITGDFSFNEYFPVKESNISLMCLGHYETERYGVCQTKTYTEDMLGLKTVFIEE